MTLRSCLMPQDAMSPEQEAELLAMLEKTIQEGLGAEVPPGEGPDQSTKVCAS